MTTDHTLVIAVLFVIVIPVAMLLFMTLWLVQRRRAVRATAALSDTSEKLNKAMEVGQALLQESCGIFCQWMSERTVDISTIPTSSFSARVPPGAELCARRPSDDSGGTQLLLCIQRRYKVECRHEHSAERKPTQRRKEAGLQVRLYEATEHHYKCSKNQALKDSVFSYSGYGSFPQVLGWKETSQSLHRKQKERKQRAKLEQCGRRRGLIREVQAQRNDERGHEKDKVVL